MNHCDTCRHLKQEETFASAFDVCGLLSGRKAGAPAYASNNGLGTSFVVVDPAAFGCTLHEPEETA